MLPEGRGQRYPGHCRLQEESRPAVHQSCRLGAAQLSSSSLMVMRRGQMRKGSGDPSPRVPPM